MLLFSSIFSQNILSLEYSGGDSLMVVSFTESEIGGFSFDSLEGIEIIDAYIPDTISSDFNISFSSNTIVGFQMTGATIPNGNNILAVVFFNTESVNESICFETECFNDTSTNNNTFYDCTLSDPSGQIIQLDNYSSQLDYCVEGCFDESACNFLETSECEYAVTYYQDADNDGNGNPDITEAYCEPINGWVTNSDDADDTCSGTLSPVDSSCCLSSIFDDCDVCDGDDSSCAGCDGIANSGTIEDSCGVCNGDGMSCAGCDGISNSGIVEDACGNCGGDCIADNNGTILCSGNISENLIVADCNGVCDGPAIISGCDEICSSTLVDDDCGICGGDNSTCTGCLDEVACNYNSLATIENTEFCVYANVGEDCEGNLLSDNSFTPYEVSITSAYPNPFNPSINIEYSVSSIGHVILQVIGVDGQHINTITNSIQTQGLYNVQWTPENISSGMYLIQLEANSQIQNKKIVYLK